MRDRFTTDELEAEGFEIIKENLAKHKDYETYRNRCSNCGDWVKETVGGKDGRRLCKRCLVRL